MIFTETDRTTSVKRVCDDYVAIEKQAMKNFKISFSDGLAGLLYRSGPNAITSLPGVQL